MWLSISPTIVKKTFSVIHACPDGKREQRGGKKVDIFFTRTVHI